MRCEHLRVTRLERGAVTLCIDIKRSNRAQKRIRIFAGASVVLIDVRNNCGPVPEALEQAEHLRRL